MKVDFLGARSELIRLLGTPATATTPRQVEDNSFGKLIRDIDPNAPKPVAKEEAAGEQLLGQQPAIALEKGPMARYSFDSPSLLTPQLEPRELPQIPDEIEKGSVKTPTVLSVKRRPSAELLEADNLAQQPKAERIKQVTQMVGQASQKQGVDPALGMAVINAESSFDPKALSSDGHFSKGLFQLLDSTAKTIIERDGIQTKYQPYEPKQNVDLGTRYLRYLHDFFRTESSLPNKLKSFPTANSAELEKLAVAAFNAGEGRVASAQARAHDAGLDPANYQQISRYLPKSTNEYVQRVFEFKPQFDLSFGEFESQ